jgi:DNA transformation protein and related proteins
MPNPAPDLSDGQSPVSSIKNLGPASEAAFAKAGIHSAEALRALGADEAYRLLLQSGSSPHFIGYYVLVMALQGRPWNDCKGAEKAALRKRFDALKAGVTPQGQSELEKALNFLGVIERRR